MATRCSPLRSNNQVDGIWFPASRRVVRAENGKVITRVIEFHNPKIRFASEQATR